MDALAHHLRTVADEWDLHRNEHTTRLEARTLETFEDRQDAFDAAQELVEEILDLGFELTGIVHVGVWRPGAGEEWRGTVDLGLNPNG